MGVDAPTHFKAVGDAGRQHVDKQPVAAALFDGRRPPLEERRARLADRRPQSAAVELSCRQREARHADHDDHRNRRQPCRDPPNRRRLHLSNVRRILGERRAISSHVTLDGYHAPPPVPCCPLVSQFKYSSERRTDDFIFPTSTAFVNAESVKEELFSVALQPRTAMQ